MSKWFWFNLAVIVAVIAIALLVILPAAISCAADGGAYIKGVIWYACVGGNR